MLDRVTTERSPSSPPWLRGKLRRVRWVLAWERLWRALWPVAGLAALAVGLALLEVPRLLGPLGHWIALIGALVLLTAVAAWRLHDLRRPTDAEAHRALETRSGTAHRPLTASLDRNAIGRSDKLTEALWRAHLQAMRERARGLRVGGPRPGIMREDPWGLRLAPVLVLAIGIWVGWGEAGTRLLAAVTPPELVFGDTDYRLRLWISPPDYVAAAPQRLEAGPDTPAAAVPVHVYAGSTVLIQAEGLDAPPVLAIDDRRRTLHALGPESARLEARLDGGHSLTVEDADGDPLASWPLTVQPDDPPMIAFAQPPSTAGGWRLHVEYTAGDDHGVTGASVLVGRVGVRTEQPLILDLPFGGERPVTLRSRADFDLAAHVWAGLPVTLTLSAEDATGQTGHSQTVETVLPERRFTHAVAQQIIAARKTLIRQPSETAEALLTIDAISRAPARYDGDLVVFLALRTVYKRLQRDQSDPVFHQVLDLLWKTAVRLEDGALASAEQGLAEAQEALERTLADPDATPEAIARAVDRFREALDRFMRQLQEKLAGLKLDALPPSEAERIFTADDLNKTLESLTDLARLGDREALERAMENLRAMAEALRRAPEALSNLEAMADRLQAMQDLNREFGALTAEQERLLERSFTRRQERDDPVVTGSPERSRDHARGNRADAEDQTALRDRLGALLQKLEGMVKEVPPELGTAGEAMDEAAGALRIGDDGLDRTVEAQTEALDLLRQGSEDARQGMIDRLLRGSGQGGMSSGLGRPGGRRDPLDRPPGRLSKVRRSRCPSSRTCRARAASSTNCAAASPTPTARPRNATT